ncbi:DASS family sodium-coupled anion symporter [Peptococcaceae bacterium]|nr:DASS family sodium-coupled anion symporter [Peptococcaceae bacterium]
MTKNNNDKKVNIDKPPNADLHDPERLIAKKEPSLVKRGLLILLAVAVGIVIYSLPTPEGLPEIGHLYLALVAALLILFLTEPIPLPLVMVISGIGMIVLGIADREAIWTAYASSVVFFILGCLMLAIIAEEVGLTERFGRFLLKIAGTNVIRFSFVMCMGLGLASSVMHDIAATAIGLMVMLPLMRAAGIQPGSRNGLFLTISLPFCCSAGGMGTLVGGGRNMVAAYFLEKETDGQYTIGFVEWLIYAFPGALISIPLVWLALYLVFRPDTKLHFRELTEEEKAKKPFSAAEVKALILIGLVFLAFFTRDWHGICFSIVVMAGTAIAIFLGLIDWKKLHQRTEWAVCFLVFGGGISLGMQMGASGAAEYLAGVFFPFFEGKGWLLLVIAVGVFASLITNLMANVAAAALILPIAIPLAIMEGVDPTLVALTLGMWTSFAYLLVIGCPPNVVAYSFGYFKPHDLARAGLVAMPIAWIAMIITAVVWWEIIGLV